MILTAALALAQTLADVPAGARAVTVYACAKDCEPGWRALGAWSNTLRLPTMDFEQVAVSARDDRLTTFENAMAKVRGKSPTPEQVSVAVSALRACPYTIANEDLFLLAMAQASTGIYAVDREALVRAANTSERRTYNLPPLPENLLAAYLDIAAAPIERIPVTITADATPAAIFIDGRPAGVAPETIGLPPGPHRITIERPGRKTAWVAEIDLRQEVTVAAQIAGDDSNAALERTVLAAIENVQAPAADVAPLATWARDEGLEWVRFVSLGSQGSDEVIPDPDPAKPGWRVRDAYLDVARGRLVPEGPGTNAMIAAADVERFRVGAMAGYLHLAPRDHITLDLATSYRFSRFLSADLRLGVAHSAQPYYLYEDWIDAQVYPLSLGIRVGEPRGGPYAGIAAVAAIPFALGGEARAGWEFAPSFGWRVSVEARGGATDKGFIAGVAVGVASRR